MLEGIVDKLLAGNGAMPIGGQMERNSGTITSEERGEYAHLVERRNRLLLRKA